MGQSSESEAEDQETTRTRPDKAWLVHDVCTCVLLFYYIFRELCCPRSWRQHSNKFLDWFDKPCLEKGYRKGRELVRNIKSTKKRYFCIADVFPDIVGYLGGRPIRYSDLELVDRAV